MASSNVPNRPSEADIPTKPHPGSSKDQATAAASQAGPKPYSHHGHRDLNTAAADAAAAAGEHYHQHSNPHDAAHGPAGYSQQGNSHPAHHSPYTNPYHPADAQQAAAYMAAAAAANMRAAAGAGGEGHPSDIHQQHYQQQQQQQQQQGPPQLGSPGLPEAAPSTKTDPVELSLLTTYLRVVRQTQGEAAAAQAMAASGLPTGASLEAEPSPDYTAPPSIHSSTAPTAPSSSATTGSAPAPAAASYAGSSGSNGSTPTAAAGSSEGMGGDPLAVSNLLGFIKSRKLTGIARQPPSRRSSSGSTASAHGGSSLGVNSAAAGSAGQGRKVWIQPSGPRRPGEGVENEEQGILSAEEVPTTGEVMMRITLLAAGFVIGPSGSSVREIVRLSGADINSWTEATGSHRGRRPARIFLIKGEPSCVAQAVYVIFSAVDRYKELCEGKYTGQSVPRSQNILGITFSYQPPPKSIVPCAASLKELYAPQHTVANSGRYSVSPPGMYGLHPHSSRGAAAAAAAAAGARGFRGSPPQMPGYHPHAYLYDQHWQTAAMMNAAAAMGLTPLQALAAAGGHHGAAAAAAAAAAGFGGLGGVPGQFGGPFVAGVAGMMGFGGFEGELNPLGVGAPPAGLDPMAAAAAGLNPYAAAMMQGGADVFGATGANMFGMLPVAGAAAAGPGGEGPAAAAGSAASSGPPSMEGLPPLGVVPGATVGNPWAAWFPGMYDATGMAALMAGAGLYAPLGAAGAADPTAAGADGLFQQGHMTSAAMAAAGLDPAALAAMDGSSAGLGRLSAGLGPSAAGSELSTPTAGGAGAEAAAGAMDEAAAAAGTGGGGAAAGQSRLGREASGNGRGDGRHSPQLHRQTSHPRNHTGPLWPGGLPPPSPFYRGPGLHLPHLIIPQERSDGTHPASPTSARPGRTHSGMPFPPASPGAPMLNFGPLFHPMSPAAARMAPMSPYMGSMPFGPVPPSPVRLMRDKSGQHIPYVEVGGTVYFAPASPMPPQGGSPPHGSPGRPIPPPMPPAEPYPGSDHGLGSDEEGEQQQEGSGQQFDGSGSPDAAAAAAGGSGTPPGTGGSTASSRSLGHGSSGDATGGDGRPRSAMQLFADNPYLSQNAIGSGHQQHGDGSSSGDNSQQRRQQQQQQQQWQAKHNAGSSNSVGGPMGAPNGRRQGVPSSPGRNHGGSSSSRGNNRSSPPTSTRPQSAGGPVATQSDDPATQKQEQQQQRPTDDAAYTVDQSPGPAAAAAAPKASLAAGGRSPSMNELAAAAAGSSAEPAAGSNGSSVSRQGGNRAGRTDWLATSQYDPIMSPGRITLASKVKAARLYNHTSNPAAGGQQGGKGGHTPQKE